MMGCVAREDEFHAALNECFIVFELIEQLISSEEGNCFGSRAERSFGYALKPIEDDSIEYIEAIIALIANLCQR